VIWKSVGVLAGAAGVVLLSVIGLSWAVVNVIPDFDEGFSEAEANPDGSVEFVPSGIGGELNVTGDREVTLELAQGFSEGPGFELAAGNGKVFVESSPLSVATIYVEDLAFFPDPDACEFTPGEVNDDLGLAATRLVCPQLDDIRDNGSIAVEGYLALPADMVIDRDLPELGGTVIVGGETWDMNEASLFIAAEFNFGGEPEPVYLSMWSSDYERGVNFEMDRETEGLRLASIYSPDGQTEVSGGSCSINTDFLVQVNPTTSIETIDFVCEGVDVSGAGTVPVSGSVTFSKSYAVDIEDH
jgi:hypothetical protein